MKLRQPDISALLRLIRTWTLLFMLGLVLSGATAIPLRSEVDRLVRWTGAEHLTQAQNPSANPAWAAWLLKVRAALNDTGDTFPFLFYGTDWLAFGHFVIALAFVGALRNPLRNAWLFDFGILACLLVVPYAFVFGAVRAVPLWWRFIDSCFGVFGLVPMWLCRRWTGQLEQLSKCNA